MSPNRPRRAESQMEPTETSGSSVDMRSDTFACPLCASQAIRTSMYRETFPHGTGESLVEIAVDVPVRYCGTCDFHFQDQEAERLKQDALCRHLGVLTPREIRNIRMRYEMSRSDFAQLTGIGEASLNRWENGINVQTVANDRYLRLIALPQVFRVLQGLESVDTVVARALDSMVQRFPSLIDAKRAQQEQEAFELRSKAA